MSSSNPLPIFVVGLRRFKRYHACLQRFDDIGLRPEFFEGADGAEYIPLQPGEKLNFMARGTAACALTHYRLWKHALDKGYGRIAVFEDDADGLHPDLKAFLTEAAAFDDNIELINLTSNIYGNRSLLFSIPLKSSSDATLFLMPHLMIGAQGYIVNHIGLNKLISRAMPITLPVDTYMGSYEKHGLRIYISNQKWINTSKDTKSERRNLDGTYTDGTSPPPSRSLKRARYIVPWVRYQIRKRSIPWRRRLYAVLHAREFFIPNAFPSRLALIRYVIKRIGIVW